MELSRNSYQQWLWDHSAETDTHRAGPRNYLEEREHSSATAFVKGTRCFAKEAIQERLLNDRFEASRQLIESSRELVATSRRLIVEAKNTLAFGRTPRRLVI